MSLEIIDSVQKILDTTEQEYDISLGNITPSDDQSIVAKPDVSNCLADLDICSIRQFTNLLDINGNHDTSQISIEIPIQHSSTPLTDKSKEKNKDIQHLDKNILSI